MKTKDRGVKKITPQIVDHIKTLRAAGLKAREINVVLERDYDTTISNGLISDIVNGHRNADMGDFQEEDKDYILSLQENMEDVDQEIPRLEKFGVAYMIGNSKIEDTIAHFKISNIFLTEEKINDICDEVDKWIAEGDLRDENEKWFGDLIGRKLA